MVWLSSKLSLSLNHHLISLQCTLGEVSPETSSISSALLLAPLMEKNQCGSSHILTCVSPTIPWTHLSQHPSSWVYLHRVYSTCWGSRNVGHNSTIPAEIAPFVKTIFEKLSDDSLMQRCVLGATQNQNESFNRLTASPNNSIILREAVYFSCDPWVWRFWKSVSLSLTGGKNSLSNVFPEVKVLPWLPDWQITVVL